MYEFSKAELSSFYNQVAVRVAEKIGVVDAEWKSRGELGIEIQRLSPDISFALSQFYDAYQTWYDTCYKEGSAIAAGGNDDDGYEYVEIAFARDDARKRLIEQLNSYRR